MRAVGRDAHGDHRRTRTSLVPSLLDPWRRARRARARQRAPRRRARRRRTPGVTAPR
jgi:hypothetical protein